eukprot:TRINITY_DN3211_c0_g1_i2.p1 TRINITY_DN3211_c0_g1~~TRINITY_DN3211_c0_g1_i2.p1  ORF type:complete len:203 (-),score=19.78 TRINITY_DN3211_c0_g1_i2:7-615(-)
MVNKAGAIVNITKLDWINGEHMKLMLKEDPMQLLNLLESSIKQHLGLSAVEDIPCSQQHLLRILEFIKEDRHTLLTHLARECSLFIVEPDIKKNMNQLINHLETVKISPEAALDLLQKTVEGLEKLTQDSEPQSLKKRISHVLSEVGSSCNIKFRGLFPILRFFIIGRTEGYSVADMIVLIGLDTSLKRLRKGSLYFSHIRS